MFPRGNTATPGHHGSTWCRSSEGRPHIVIYGHYDVQPADPVELWDSPPFGAEVRGDRIYGRGAADNKGEVITHMCALARVFDKHPDLPLRITYLIEGEEEIAVRILRKA